MLSLGDVVLTCSLSRRGNVVLVCPGVGLVPMGGLLANESCVLSTPCSKEAVGHLRRSVGSQVCTWRTWYHQWESVHSGKDLALTLSSCMRGREESVFAAGSV